MRILTLALMAIATSAAADPSNNTTIHIMADSEIVSAVQKGEQVIYDTNGRPVNTKPGRQSNNIKSQAEVSGAITSNVAGATKSEPNPTPATPLDGMTRVDASDPRYAPDADGKNRR
jgi:hypothetical protein